MLNKLGVKTSLCVSFALAVSGASFLLFYGISHQGSSLFAVAVLMAKLGISSAFNIIYNAHPLIFPVLFSATALGICNFTTRVFTGVSPMLAQMEEPTPVMVLFLTTLLGLLIVWGI